MEISFRSLVCRLENWRRRLIRDPFPKDLFMEAWNARHGYSLDSNRTQAAYLPLAKDRYDARNNNRSSRHVCFKTKKSAM